MSRKPSANNTTPPLPLVPEALSTVLQAIAGSAIAAEDLVLAENVDEASIPEVLEALNKRDPSRFQLLWAHEHQSMTNALLRKHLGGTGRVLFLFTEVDFVSRHLRKLFEKYEGSACCADKTRWCVVALARNLVDGKPVVVDRNQQYTFFLPERILSTEEQLLRAFDGLYRMYYGDVLPWLQLLADLQEGKAIAVHPENSGINNSSSNAS